MSPPSSLYLPDDGTTIPDGVGEGTGPNGLNAFMDGIYGNRATRDLRPVFARWGELSGNTYILEPNDDNSTLFNNPGVAGVRGDLRMGGKPIDGNSGILAYNFFPQNGDMVVDSPDSFYNNTGSQSLRLRNVLAHEHGHGDSSTSAHKPDQTHGALHLRRLRRPAVRRHTQRPATTATRWSPTTPRAMPRISAASTSGSRSSSATPAPTARA